MNISQHLETQMFVNRTRPHPKVKKLQETLLQEKKIILY